MSLPLVLVSYSHKDEEWSERLHAHLSLPERQGLIELTEANEFTPLEVVRVVPSVRVAVLLISADFLASEFLQFILKQILDRAQRGQLTVLPIIVRSCNWTSIPGLSQLQVRPLDGTPLALYGPEIVDQALAGIAQDVLALVKTGQAVSHAPTSLSVGQIRLQGIRGFRDLSIDLKDETKTPRPRTLIIGRNGTCKTTLLRAIALSLCDPVDAGSLIAEPIGSLVSGGMETAEIQLTLASRLANGESFTLRQQIRHAQGKDTILDVESLRPSPGPFVCAYGAGRFGVGTDTGRDYRIRDSVATLFDYRQTLIDSELTLRRLQDFLGTQRFDTTLRGVKRVLGLTDEDEILLAKGGGVEVSGPSGHVRLEGWADGYRLTFAWLLDLYGWAMRADRITADGGIAGILLIDEIEQHLHPSMQTGILPRLSEVLPDLQIIATTHSPLVALGAAPEELVSLRHEHGSVVAEPSVPDFSEYSAEDMLVDERLFDTEAYGPETTEKLARYRELVKIPPPRRDREQTQELQSLAVDLRDRQIPEAREGPAAAELKRLIAKHNL